MFAVVFGLSMDYEVFLISRVREEWVRRRDASAAVADGIAFTGRVISAAAAIMVCVFLSFMLGNERSVKEFGFGLAAAVFLDALVVRCVLLPAVLELLGRPDLEAAALARRAAAPREHRGQLGARAGRSARHRRRGPARAREVRRRVGQLAGSGEAPPLRGRESRVTVLSARREPGSLVASRTVSLVGQGGLCRPRHHLRRDRRPGDRACRRAPAPTAPRPISRERSA